MAVTRLHLRQTTNARGKALTTAIGSSGGTYVSVISAAGPAQLLADHWWYQPGAMTLSGTVTFNLWGLELSMAANAGFRVEMARTNSSGTDISSVVASSRGVELGTSSSVHNWTASATSTTFAATDYLRASVYLVDAGGTMASGTELRAPIYDDTAGNLAESWVEVDLTAAASDPVPRFTTAARQAVHRSASW